MASKRVRASRTAESRDTPGGRAYVSQSDVPAYSLEQALRIARAISDNFGRGPARPLRLAEAMNLAPSSSGFRMLCGASIAYGLTDGGYNSELISLTPLGRRIVAPTSEGDDEAARREASLRPRVIKDFLTRYNESKLPPENIGRNVLEEIGVPGDRTAPVYQLIVESANAAGFLREVKGHMYVDLHSVGSAEPTQANPSAVPAEEGTADVVHLADPIPISPPNLSSSIVAPLKRTSRVFITHGKNQDIVSQLKELLTFGGFTPVVAIENETVSKPLPDKVMDEMRTCSAAVIHVGGEQKMMDAGGKEHLMLNQNVLIEVGAAMALYGRKFIMLVERGATLPSNLQGLYEVRYEGGKLDYEATMKLLKAFNDFRS